MFQGKTTNRQKSINKLDAKEYLVVKSISEEHQNSIDKLREELKHMNILSIVDHYQINSKKQSNEEDQDEPNNGV